MWKNLNELVDAVEAEEKNPTPQEIEQDRRADEQYQMYGNQSIISEDKNEDYKCPHCGSTKGFWFDRTMPMAYVCKDCGEEVDDMEGEPNV